MSNKDGFAGGFIAGAIVGSVVGGLLGVLLARKADDKSYTDESLINANRTDAKPIKGSKKHQIKEDSIEPARRSLEAKIAQLNETIDDVRQQLGSVNGTSQNLESQRSRADES
jgi:Na+/glutamate symporter